MEIVFEHNNSTLPKVSLILLDWSCRESFHILEYLKNQTIPGEQYEIIWIEYYSRRSSEIKTALEECKKLGKPPAVDKWIVMDMPDDTYYHKHLMYNVGIITSKGEIITICDSDVVVTETFIESIFKSFEQNPDTVLHLDEVRNTDKRFYPFNYPSKEEIIGKGCINFKDGNTTGLLDKADPIHTRNYSACMSALRKDLINIGGADEHSDYLGHICGPYEMTFRLVNAGKREIWHQEEFLYQEFDDAAVERFEPFDIVVMNGLLHHLPDDAVISLLKKVKRTLREGGRLVTLDCYRAENQSFFVRKMLEKDRGKYIRQKEDYVELASEVFDSVVAHIRNDLMFVPYPLIIMEISESGKNDISKQERK